MAELTPNLGLRKPEEDDHIDVMADIAHNMDLIDSQALTATAHATLDHSGFGGGSKSLYLVAASDSTDENKAQAQWVCDGENDEAEIQAAIDASGSTAGGSVTLLQGNYYIADTIYPAGIFVGSGRYGTALRWAGADGTMLMPQTGGIYVAHLNLDGGIFGSSRVTCIDSGNSSECMFDDLGLSTNKGIDVRLGYASKLTNSSLFTNGVGVDVAAYNGAKSVVVGNDIRAYTCAIVVSHASAYIAGNFLGGGGSNIDSSLWLTDSPYTDYDFVTDAPGSGIALIDSGSNVVIGNRIFGIPGHGILISANCDNNMVIGNRIESFGQRQPGSWSYSGVHIKNQSNGNLIQANAIVSNTYINSRWGIRIDDNGCYDNVVVDNMLKGAAGRGSPSAADNFSDAGSNTRTGPVVYAPNGTAYMLRVANDGTISTEAV